MSSNMVIVERLSVVLRREHHGARSLRELAVRRAWREPFAQAERVQVLTDVSFTVAAGSMLAVIGPNGAGKTTLLRTLAGVIPPSVGRVRVAGRIAPLIDLGAGFDPELTGMENTLLLGSLLGMPLAQLRRDLDEIAAFAGVGDVLDVPVKHYSTGMAVRLGFAVATAARPDVLIVDEVLAVGDEEFRARCAERIRNLRDGGTAVVLASHDLGLVEREASECLLLDRGAVRAAGPPEEAVQCYRREVAA